MGKSGALNEEWSPFRIYGRKYRAFCWQNSLTITLLVAGAICCYWQTANLAAYQWNWQSVFSYVAVPTASGWKPGLLLEGLFTTLRVGFWTFVFSLALGGLLGFLASGKSFWATIPYQILINLFRNTPPLILLFCVYFLIGNVIPIAPLEDAIRDSPDWLQTGIHLFFAPQRQIGSMVAALLALGIYQATYVAEIVRGSIENVPKPQWDAALALGFGRAEAFRLIILPQALRLAIPPLTGQCVSTFKESALASLISLPELTFQSLEIMAVSGMTFEVWICTGILYLAIGFICSCGGAILERIQSRHIV